MAMVERCRWLALALGALAGADLAAPPRATWSGTESTGTPTAVRLFGDSISSGLAGSLGAGGVTYAKGGLATASLIQQLQGLGAQPVRCPTAIIPTGTNDAMLPISDQPFQANLAQILTLVRGLEAERIHLLPAFSCTVAASQRPSMAGPIWRIDQLNGLIQTVAAQGQVPAQATVMQPLFVGAGLRSDDTVDGVHLNDAGKAVDRKGLLG